MKTGTKPDIAASYAKLVQAGLSTALIDPERGGSKTALLQHLKAFRETRPDLAAAAHKVAWHVEDKGIKSLRCMAGVVQARKVPAPASAESRRQATASQVGLRAASLDSSNPSAVLDQMIAQARRFSHRAPTAPQMSDAHLELTARQARALSREPGPQAATVKAVAQAVAQEQSFRSLVAELEANAQASGRTSDRRSRPSFLRRIRSWFG